MRRGLSIWGALALWAVLTLCVQSTHVINRGTSINYGPLIVSGGDLQVIGGGISATGDIGAGGNLNAGRSVTGDSLTATARLQALQCLLSNHTLAVQDSGRINKGMYVGGQFINKILLGSGTIDFDLTSATEQDRQFTLTGASVGDNVFLAVPNGSVTATVSYSAWVSSANTINVRAKTRVAGENPASGTFKAVVFQ